MPPERDATSRATDRRQQTARSEEASVNEVGQRLALSGEHVRGLHLEPRPDCWRCGSQSMHDDARGGG